jgi:predicted nucleic acid-binding protein
MIVVADASPLNYLIQIESEDLLEKLYGRVFVPSAVIEELAHPCAPAAIVSWLSRMPAWIEVRAVAIANATGLHRLHPGERAAIILSEEIHADLLLIDEKEGRTEAKRRGLLTIGTLGVLLAAGNKRLIDPQDAFRKLMADTTFRASTDITERFLSYCKKSSKPGC